MSNYHKLYTPQDSAVVFIDQAPQMTFAMASSDRATMINNVTLLAKVAKEFNVPTVLTAVETESFSGYIWPQLLDIFPGQAIVERSSMNSWDDPGFRKAIEATGRKNILMTGLWTEVCITWPTIEMLGAGYNIYVIEDCCGATSPAAPEAARDGHSTTRRKFEYDCPANIIQKELFWRRSESASCRCVAIGRLGTPGASRPSRRRHRRALC